MASQEKLERVVLQRRLLKVWLANHVDDSYQAIALPYFDRLSPKQANQALLDELKEHYEGVSGYYRLKETILQRENIIRGLSHRLSLLARSESTPTAEPELR